MVVEDPKVTRSKADSGASKPIPGTTSAAIIEQFRSSMGDIQIGIRRLVS